MSREIYWLALTLGLTLLFWVPYVLNRMVVRGIGGTMANPKATDTPLSAWAERAKAAHANAIENLAVFAPAALAVHGLGAGDATTAFGCALYFFSRLVHFPRLHRWNPGVANARSSLAGSGGHRDPRRATDGLAVNTRVALIVGAGGVLGAATREEFAGAGYTVVGSATHGGWRGRGGKPSPAICRIPPSSGG